VRIILKWGLNKYDKDGVVWILEPISGLEPVTTCFEHGNEPSGFIKWTVSLDLDLPP
jgi:hypothetical protein